MMKQRAFRLAVYGVGCLLAMGTEVCAADVMLWAANPLQKIFQNTPMPPKSNTDFVAIEALRNEYEPAQICITSQDYEGPVRVQVTPLTHVSEKFEITGIDARFVGYVKTPPKSANKDKFPFADSPAAYPDPLLLDEEVRLAPHQTQPVWLTVKVPKDAVPGQYTGKIEVTTTWGKTTMELRLQVYPMILPDSGGFWLGTWGGDSKLSALFGVAPYEAWKRGDYSQDYLAYLTDVTVKNRLAHRARLFSDQPFWEMNVIKVFWKDGKYDYDFSALDKLVSAVEAGYGDGQFRIIGLGVVDKTTAANGGELAADGQLTSRIEVLNPDGTVNPEQSVNCITVDSPRYRTFIKEYFKATEQHLREKGWLDKVSFKVLDEPTGKLVAPTLRLNSFIRQVAPGIRLDATYWEPATAVTMSQAADIDWSTPCVWTITVSKETVQSVKNGIARGREFLLYNDPKIVINEPWMLTRKVGWTCAQLGAKGYVHWAYCWKSDPWNEAYDATWGFGAHFLVYPDMKRKQIVDSVRWELLRETAEDFDTLELLRKLDKRSYAVYAKKVAELTGAASDPAYFYELRHRLLQEIQRRSR